MEVRLKSEGIANLYIKSPITAREKEILSLMAEGNLYTEIAALLKLSPLTVRTHVKNAYLKLGVHNKIEALSKIEWLSASSIRTTTTYC